MEILQGLYDQFVGRDLFAKIGPGAILLAAVAWYVDYDLSKASAGDWIFAAVLSWLTGLGVQSLGEWTGWLRYHPKGISDRDWHDKVGTMLELPGYKDKYRAGYERLIVIKEASGVCYIALGLAALTVVYRHTIDYFAGSYGPSWPRVLPLAVIVIAIIVLLGRMHFQHVERQSDYVDRVLKRAAGARIAQG
jgi:hypothetical protein